MIISKKLLLSTLLASTLIGCSEMAVQPSHTSQKAKNVILLIGDGMGPQQIGLLLSYARQAPKSVLPSQRTAFDRIMDDGRLGLSVVHPDAALVVDSAASATQMATGKMSGSEMIGVDKDGNRQATILDKAKKLGKATGLVSDTRITHATPAAFAAHQGHRHLETDIADDLLNTDADLMLSGGLSHFLPKAVKDEKSALHQQVKTQVGAGFVVSSARQDDKNLLDTAKAQGYQLVFNKEQLQQATGKTLGLFADSLMSDGIAENKNRDTPARLQPTLKEMTEQALNILSKRPEGFFLMVEGGQIDMAAHRNDTGRLLHEMLKFNDTLNAVLDWVAHHPDTLVVVTADHETGGFGFSYSGVNIPQARRLAGNAFGDKAMFKPDYNFGNPDVLDKLYAQQLSYEAIFKQFDTLPVAEKNADALVALVNRNSAFKINNAQAEAILSTEKNPLYQPDHSTLGDTDVPKMPSYNRAFFPYQKDNRQNLLAQAVSEQQQVVWATGTHTSTPVLVFVHGQTPVLVPFTKLLHHSELGRLLGEAM